jgi:type IV secretory pathway VirB4 component
MLELVERTSSLMAKLELNEQIEQAEKILNDFKQQFDETINKILNEDNEEKLKHFEQLRPTFGHPARKNDLQEIDNQEKLRQNQLQQTITQLRSNTIVNKTKKLLFFEIFLFSGRYSNKCSSNS